MTENLRRFGISPLSSDRNLSTPSQQLIIDGQVFLFSSSSPLPLLPFSHFCNLDGSSWAVCNDESWVSSERNPVNYGPLRQVIEGPVIIVYGTLVCLNNCYTKYLQKILLYNISIFINNYVNSFDLTLILFQGQLVGCGTLPEYCSVARQRLVPYWEICNSGIVTSPLLFSSLSFSSFPSFLL